MSFVITALLYVRQGQEEAFRRYESLVLPILRLYKGELREVIIPQSGNAEELPTEIHVVAFPSEQHFEDYKKDTGRQQYTPMLNEVIDKIIVINGTDGKHLYE